MLTVVAHTDYDSWLIDKTEGRWEMEPRPAVVTHLALLLAYCIIVHLQ